MGPRLSRGRLADSLLAKTRMAGIAPGHFIFACVTSPRRGSARRGRRQRGRAAVEQRRDAADGDAPGDAAPPPGLLPPILLPLTLRGPGFFPAPRPPGQAGG